MEWVQKEHVVTPAAAPTPAAATPAPTSESLTVAELKDALSRHGIDYSACVEKAELQRLLDAHRSRVQRKLDARRSRDDSRWL